MRVLVTEMAGRASLELKGRELGVDLAGQPDVLSSAVRKVKELESRGWSFEAADASLELLLRNEMLRRMDAPPFVLESYRVILDHRIDGERRLGGDGQAARRGRARPRDGGGQRPGPRPGRRAAQGPAAPPAVAGRGRS